MDLVLVSLSTLVAGLLLGWLACLARVPDRRADLGGLRLELAGMRDEVTAAHVQLAAAVATEGALREQLETIRGDRAGLVDGFKVQAGDVLAERSKELVDRLAKFDEKVERLEGERREQAGALGEQIKALGLGVGELGKNADSLVTALRRPNVRGAWGELQLDTAFEHAGLIEGVNYTRQHTVAGAGAGRLRPDAVVSLTGGKSVAVDAKVPLAAYQEACEADDPDVRKERLARHAVQVRAHVKGLSGKEYQAALRMAGSATPDFVVMFIPSEAMFFAALEADPGLLEDALRSKVLIAAPMSLIAILQAVHVGWQQEQIATDAREIAAIATELHRRFACFFGHFEGIGRELDSAVEKYNKAVGSYEGSVLPQVRKLEDHQIRSGKTLGAGRPVEKTTRTVTRRLTLDGAAAAELR